MYKVLLTLVTGPLVLHVHEINSHGQTREWKYMIYLYGQYANIRKDISVHLGFGIPSYHWYEIEDVSPCQVSSESFPYVVADEKSKTVSANKRTGQPSWMTDRHEKITKKFRQNPFSDLRGDGQRSRPPAPNLDLPRPPPPPLSPLSALGTVGALRAKFFYLPFPRILLALIYPLSLLPSHLPSNPSYLPSYPFISPYLLPFPPPHLRDELENI